MAGWDDVVNEIRSTKSDYDIVRNKYLKKLSKYTGRCTIAYYSSWLTKGSNIDSVLSSGVN